MVVGEVLTVSEFARACGVSADAVRRWERLGQITAIKSRGGVRFFPVEELHRAQRALQTRGARP